MTIRSVFKGSAILIAGYVAGISTAEPIKDLYNSRTVGCIVNTADEAYAVSAGKDVKREPLEVNWKTGECEPLSLALLNAVPIQNGLVSVRSEEYNGIPEGFEYASSSAGRPDIFPQP